MIKFRKLNADEIDARVATVSTKGCSLLLYKDARVDQNILDETVGAENWQRSHEIIGNNLYCTVSIWDESKKQWIKKQDVGTESYTEKEKGQASDSFKRACFNWGIGRELYTAPFIWVGAENVNLEDGKDGKKTTKDSFMVKSIGYDEAGNINHLVIANKRTKKVVYNLGNKANSDNISGYPSREEMIREIKKKYPEGTEYMLALLGSLGVDSLDKATDEMLQAAYNKAHK